MRNLKKILALAVAFVMAFAFTAGAATTFSDASEIGADYIDDVNMLVELGVVAGYPDGSFQPQGNITRAEFAKMAYTLKYGSDTDGNLFAGQKSNFVDVEGVSDVAWAKGYINYCANQRIVSGIGNNMFNPNGNITVAEATKMILVIMGVDPDKEGLVGSNWISNTTALGIQLGVYDGWAGDPTQAATRELVCKLMKNAVFAPVFEYSAITGMGSQFNSLTGDKNQTLGEKTMDLKTVTGIVVANERYFLDTDEEGETLDGLNIAATGIDSEESLILYEAKDNNGDINLYTLRIDRALDDDMLGNKVNVFFKADASSSAEYNYKNVEVIGDVLINSDTVAYEVSAANVKLMPDGQSNSTTEIVPYIGFTVDGVEKQIKAPTGTERLRRDQVAFDEGIGEVFANYAYVSTETLRGNDDATLVHPEAQGEFFEAMGKGSITSYRFVSVDGGKTYSYMFKMLDADNAKFATVSNYSESRGTIYLTGIGSVDLEECVIEGEIAKDDYVVYYRENGKIYVEKVETVTGAVETFNDDGSVTINGTAYYPDVNLCLEYLESDGNFFNYYQDNRGALTANTTYYVRGNVILQIEASDDVSSVENYAVIVNSYYDTNLDTAYVKLGFSDNSEGTYKVGRFYTKYSATPNNPENDRAMDYADNARFGWVVKFTLRDDGSVDLSGQDFKSLETDADPQVATEGDVSVVEKKFTNSNGSYYGNNDNAVLFVLYGNLDGELGDEDYAPIRSRAYKLTEVTDATGEAIAGLTMNNVAVNDAISSAIVSEGTYENSIVAASMTVGDSLAGIEYKSSDRLGYVVSAMQRYNVSTGNYYADFKLISEDGLITASTIEDVTDLKNNPVLNPDYLGSLSDKDGDFAAGSFVRFAMNADNQITAVDIEGGHKRDLEFAYNGESTGLFAVNVTSSRDGRLSFYDADEDIAVVNGRPENATLNSILFAEDGYDIITIDDGTYAGSDLIRLPTRLDDETGIPAYTYNAVIQVEEGEALRVFCFTDTQYGYDYTE